jgi:hypothetical protein
MIEHFNWTAHAIERLGQRGIDRMDVEQIIRANHRDRTVNRGKAEWRITGSGTTGGAPIVVIYDHPDAGDQSRVRIVSAWVARDPR